MVKIQKMNIDEMGNPQPSSKPIFRIWDLYIRYLFRQERNT